VRRGSKTKFRAEVVFAGLDVHDLREADPVATVSIDAGTDERELARLAGMCVVAMLREARLAQNWLEPFATVGEITCIDLLNRHAVPDPSRYSIAEGWRPEDTAAVLEDAIDLGRQLSTETMFTIAFPRVGGDPAKPGKKRRFRAVLHEARGSAWVWLHSRNPVLSATGILCVIEHIAHESSTEVTEHVAQVCKRLFDLHKALCGRDVPLTRGQATSFFQLATDLSQADDPLTAPTPLDERAGD
jgi:hypothetical protein